MSGGNGAIADFERISCLLLQRRKCCRHKKTTIQVHNFQRQRGNGLTNRRGFGMQEEKGPTAVSDRRCHGCGRAASLSACCLATSRSFSLGEGGANQAVSFRDHHVPCGAEASILVRRRRRRLPETVQQTISGGCRNISAVAHVYAFQGPVGPAA
jgi:hypothetical protein